MSSEDQANAGGCDAFGHVVSAWTDGELAGTERERFEAHLPACRPCQKLGAEYRALDVAARPPYPAVRDEAWATTWAGVLAGVAADREAAEHAPLAPLSRFAERLAGPRSSRRPWVAPFGYAAAAALLVAVGIGVQRGSAPPRPASVARGGAPPAAASGASAPAPQPELVASIQCAVDYLPIVTMIEGDEGLDIVQCAWVGEG